MAYNPYTTLLLKFNNGDGQTVTANTAQGGAGVTLNGSASISSTRGMFSTNSLFNGDPFGTETDGSVTVDSPNAVFSSSTGAARRFDFWFYIETWTASNYECPFKIKWDNGASLDIVVNVFGNIYVENFGSPEFPGGGGLYAGNVPYPAAGAWHHVRLYIEDTHWVLGVDGSQVDEGFGTLSVWPGNGTNVVTEFNVGSYGPDYTGMPIRGYIDAFEVTEGDMSWAGGSYTVPTAEPDDWVDDVNKTVALTGQTYSFTQGDIAQVQHPLTVALTGQSFSYFQPLLRATKTPSDRNIWRRSPSGRLSAADLFQHRRGEIASLVADDYWEKPPTPSAALTLGLTGQSFSYVQGAITAINPTRTVMLASQLINYAQGAMTPTVVGDATVALTGQVINHASGAVGVAKTVALSGQSYSFSQGNVTATVGVFVTLTGQTYAFAQGMPTVPRAVALTGQTESIVQGVIAPSVGAVVALSGQSYSVTPGAIGKSINAVLAGQSVAFSQGAMLINPAVGANTVADVTSTGVGGSADGYKTLVLHGNTSPGVAVDSSIYANTLTNSGVTTSTIAPYMGSSAMSFSGTPSADSLTVPVGNGLFAVPGADKIFDFHIRPNGSDSGMKRVFRIDFPENYIYSSSPSYISIELNYDSGPAVRFLCYTPSVQAAVSFYYAYGTDFSLRIAFVGNKVYVGMDGVQQYSRTSDTLGPVWPQGGLPTSFVLGGSAVGFSGQIDEFLITEAPIEFHGYNGGNYNPDITEWATGQLRGRGANTLDAQTSIGTGLSGDARTGTGSNTLEAVVSTGDGFITAVVYGDSNVTLDDTTNEGNVNVGVFREAFGANTSEDVTSTGDGTINPLIYCDGASTTEAVTSDGAGLLSWNGRGANSLEAITSTGDGTAANAASLGANTVDSVTSSGSGTVAIVGVGASLTGITSQGDGTTAAYGQGASTTSVTSIGAGYVDKACLGANTTSVISLGEGITFTAGSGGNVVEQVSNGSGTVLISGNGANTTEIYTFFGPVPVPGEEDFERVDIVQAHISAIARTRQNVAYVRAP